MAYFRGFQVFDQAECQIVILASLKTYPETAGVANQLCIKDAEMAYTVLRQQQIVVPLRLEVWVESLSVFVDFILIAVNQFPFRMLIN